ncbi:HypC/HybG/HupF family hydrogenase formation chaperone [Vibrio algarum]|uniref:HypC/HybG/HupF family hydrogenase formation chaperone n=1 Tax=Vibrio algarum TaxID=3020714 RepID=A0ABT4YLH2_9VIBR|nr:HypC/HybG/HupF family hydrogenase formation chaperone [Vibrio sp. KJ40-1]MDB1122374.1 HypC/HybG/HupF family hydrogenase formation chaperone [Vibrio sp. KJ40-1]
MCIGVPALVQHVYEDKLSAIVGEEEHLRTVSLMMLLDEVHVGDYLLIQVGNFAVDKVEKQEALKAIKLQQALAEGDYERAAELY